MNSGAQMLLQYRGLGGRISWDEGPLGARASRQHALGARASRPHQAWHSLGHLPHLDQPGTAPWLSFGLAAAVPAPRVAACSIARKLSGGQRDSMRAGRPRSQALPPRRCRGECLAGDFSECRPAPFGKLPFAREYDHTNADGTNSMNSGARMLLQYRTNPGTASVNLDGLGGRCRLPGWPSLMG